MCILCVAQKWSRRVAAMLPWLLIPLSAVWALSQLLPPPLRFQIGSHHLACVGLLLAILLWYELLGPRLAVWRARRAARLRELRRVQAAELQRLRKAATRRCRNCHFAYRDQNPGGGGRFMCSYCGHVSRRPVLDVPETGWNYGRCSTERSYVLVCRLLSFVFVTAGRVWRRGGSSGEDRDREGEELSSRIQESRVEKARRKAEERRQARLEKEMLDAEERKQREEVARLVEERRRLRDVKLEAEKKSSESRGERNGGKETQRKKQERRKEKDKGSNKSNSDGEEFGGRGSEVVNAKSKASELPQGSNILADKNRYLDRMKGTFLASSKGFNSATFFGRNAQNPVSARVSKPATGFVEHKPSHGNSIDSHSVGNVISRSIQGNHQPLGQDALPRTAGLKKSWHQLFTRASAVSSNPYMDTNSWSNLNNQGEVRSTESSEQTTPINLSTDSQINSGRALPSTTHPNHNLIAHTADETVSAPLVTQTVHALVPEDAELFEDPCYIPEPSSLFGPVVRDDFPQNFGPGFVTEGHHILKNVYASADVNKPSPIKPPVSRLRGFEEKYTASGQAICPSKSQKAYSLNLDDSSKAQEQGTWQMWGTPLADNALGVIGRPSGWSFPIGLRESVQDVLPLSHDNMLSKHGKENHAMPAIVSRESRLVSNPQDGGLFSPVGHCLNESDPCMQNALSQFPVDGGSHLLPHDLIDNIAHDEVAYVIPGSSAAVHPVELPPASSWTTGQWGMRGAEGVRGQFVTTDPGVQPKWSCI